MLSIVNHYYMRVGKEVYAKKNKSYGISSLRKKHVKIDKNVIYLKFKGKSNKRLHYTIREPEFINEIKILMKLEGEKLFQYITMDDFGNEKIYSINDRDLNSYIQEYMGINFSIKDFRTYAANNYFVKALLDETSKHTPKNRTVIKRNLLNAYKRTAYQLKHTKAISKKSYVMNFAMELYQNNPMFFVERKNEESVNVVIDLLKLYKKEMID